jgi:hypothetical protein
MRQISSGFLTVWSKASLALVFAILLLMFVVKTFNVVVGAGNPLFSVALLAAAAAAFTIGKGYVWTLADVVYDCGDSLLVQRGKIKERVPLANIVDVILTAYSRPIRVTIYLSIPGSLGSEFTFVPSDARLMFPFARSRHPQDLRDRARQAKSAESVM